MTQRKKVLMTGAAGAVGGILRSGWCGRYDLCLADIRPVENTAEHEHFLAVDITKYDQMLKACEGIDTVVHLAADPNPRATFYETLLPLNIVGVYNSFHAAHEAGCRRIVFASSVNAVVGYPPDARVRCEVPIYPLNVYGATKCWGEALARVYSATHGLSCICVRLGSPKFRQNGDWDANKPADGISQRDTAQLFGRCVDVDDVPFAIVHGISRHRCARMDVGSTCQVLGYEPQDGTAFPKYNSPS